MTEFMIRSGKLDLLKDSLLKAASAIKQAINEKRAVWIRHHADTDGYCAAIALEKSILYELYNFHSRESDVFYYYRRLPSRTPYYDYNDATKDLATMLADSGRFGRKQPLMIVLDNGSSSEDTIALKKLKIFGVQIIVIDHHPPAKENDGCIDIHVNPYLHGLDSNLCAGMISAELSRFINDKLPKPFLIATIAGIADRSSSEELNEYVALSQKDGYGPEYLKELAELIDMEADSLGYSDARFYVDTLFFGEPDKQKKLVELAKVEIDTRKKTIAEISARYMKIEKMAGFAFAKVDAGNSFTRDYPIGKIAGTSLQISEEKAGMPCILAAHAEDIITFRISNSLPLDFNKMKDRLQERCPDALITGGGHPHAGTILFAKGSFVCIMDELKDYLSGYKPGAR